PGRIPIACVPIVVTATDHDDAIVMRGVPNPIVPHRMIVVKNFVVTTDPIVGVADPSPIMVVGLAVQAALTLCRGPAIVRQIQIIPAVWSTGTADLRRVLFRHRIWMVGPRLLVVLGQRIGAVSICSCGTIGPRKSVGTLATGVGLATL